MTIAASLILLPQLAVCAERAKTPPNQTTNTIVADEPTNEIVTISQLMSSNNIVTNTVGGVFVKISAGLWAGKFEVTQDEYQKVTGGNPSKFSGANLPVDSVSWKEAMTFCKTLTDKENALGQLTNGYVYLLPTQVQWVLLAGDATLDSAVTSLPPNHNTSTMPVGSGGANNLGLCDTRGNVLEWCLDPQDKAYRVLRGGAWDTYYEPSSRLEFLNYEPPDARKDDFGFRVILVVKTEN